MNELLEMTINKMSVQQKKELKEQMELEIQKLNLQIELAEKENEFTERELNFSKDEAPAICNKYFNKKYSIHKEIILTFIIKKFKNAKTQKGKIDKKCLVFEKFFERLEKEESHLHIKEDNKAA